MKTRVAAVVIAAVVTLIGIVPLAAHEETYKGTVITLKEKKLEVLVLNEKTKKEARMVFELTDKTKIFRGTAQVKLADAHISKEERVAVTINHDAQGQKATVIRLAAH